MVRLCLGCMEIYSLVEFSNFIQLNGQMCISIEVDWMLDMGFEPEIKKIVSQVHTACCIF